MENKVEEKVSARSLFQALLGSQYNLPSLKSVEKEVAGQENVEKTVFNKEEFSEVAQIYLDAGIAKKKTEALYDASKMYLLSVVTDNGEKAGKDLKHMQIETQDFIVLDQRAETKSVKTAEAVALLEKNKFSDKIKTTVSIEVKDGVDTTKIPETLLKQLDKYFTLTKTESVAKESMEELFAEKKISKEEFDNCMVVKVSHTVKVTKK